MRTQRTSPRRVLVHVGALLAVLTGLAVVYSCSLIVETRSQQCQSDGDCAGFAGYTKCDTTQGVCVGTGITSSEGGPMGCDVDGGIDAGGCYNTANPSCAAGNNSELLNACTTGCIHFDNKRVTLLSGGTLPGLPSPGPDAGM